MARKFITDEQIARRAYWVKEIRVLSGNFGVDSAKVQRELTDEISAQGLQCLLGHLRLCGSIPEDYGHDSSEEKLYSKYTDAVIAAAFGAMGIASLVLTERADAADVSCDAKGFDFVADAKAFRLTRTAKNQKDFKVQAMHGWKGGRRFATVVCPIYQLPTSASQIYKQAAERNVTLLSYTHLSVLVRYAAEAGPDTAEILLHNVFKAVQALENAGGGKASEPYWRCVNSVFKAEGAVVAKIWDEEKAATSESIELAKLEGAKHLEEEDKRIRGLSLDQALKLLRSLLKFDGKLATIKKVKQNGLLDF